MCNCSGECCVCANAGGCLAGHGDDYFIPAKKEKIIERLNNNEYEIYREYMIKYLKEKYGLDYAESKESEESKMIHKITVTKTEEKTIEEYWCIRGVKENIVTGAKSVIGEMKCTKEPTLNEIAIFLENSGADFVSVEHNFRFEPDIPFC